MNKLVLVVGAIVASAGMLVLRYGGMKIDLSKGFWQALADGYLWIVGIGMGWAAGMLFAIYVTKFEISDAISYYVPLTYTLTVLGGILLLKESVSPNKIIGSALIFIGLFFLLRSS